MWIKKFFAVIFLVPVLLFSAEQEKKQNTAPARKNVPETKEEKSTPKPAPLSKKEREALLRELSMEASRFDPKVPGLTAAHVKKVMLNDVADVLIDKKIPDDPSKVKKSGDTITYLGVRMALFKYGILLKNPELPEVTNIRLTWYKAYEVKLKKMEEFAKKLDQASVSGNLALYQKTKAEIEAYQKLLKDFADGRKYKLSSDEVRFLKRKNMLWRTEEFKKRQREKLAKAGLTSASFHERKNETVKKSSNKSSSEKTVKSSGYRKNASSRTSVKKNSRKRKNNNRSNW